MVAVAQEAPVEPNWAVIRRSPFAAIDRDTAQRWLEATIRQLWAVGDVRQAQNLGLEFYNKIMSHYRADDATPAFRDGLAEILASTFSDLYRAAPDNSQPPRPLGISLVLMVLRDFGQPSALPCFRAAMEDPTAGPRFVGAEGILAIQGELTDQQWAALVPELQQIASRESNGVVLDRVSRILQAGATGTRAETIAAALRAILDARLAGFAEGNLEPQEADGEIVDWLGERAGNADDNAVRIETAGRAGRLLVHACDTLTRFEPKPHYGQQLEELIITTERRLEALVQSVQPDATIPDPTVRVVMFEGGPQRDARMESALLGWIGTPDTPGTLNAEPFNFPVGLGVTRTKAAATAPDGT